MKLFVLLFILFAVNSNAEIYKCGNNYSQTSCGMDTAAVEFANRFQANHPVTDAKGLKMITGKVVRVTDGDTITIQTYQGKEKVRLAQIDAPEISHFGSKAQSYGKEAGGYLRQLVMNKNVRVEVEAVDQYRRNVGTVYVGGNNINREMVKNGYAWVYRQYAHDLALMNLERIARAKRIGLWSLDNPIYPPDFRKSNK